MSVKQAIPIFPLQLFLLPGETKELYIFEERYKELVNDCLKGDGVFGLVFSHSSNPENLGSLVQISELIHRYPHGEMDIRVKALSVFKLESFYLQQEGKLYPGGNIIRLEDKQNFPASTLLRNAFEIYRKEKLQQFPDLFKIENPGIFEIATLLNLSDEEKVELINSADPRDMNSYLFNFLRYINFLFEQEKLVFNNIYLN